MAFVNELISEDDRKKYDLDKVECGPGMRAKTPQRQWTIDHEREIYLRVIKRGREEYNYKSTWHFCWRGELMTVCLETLSAGGERGGHGWSHYKLVDCYMKGFFVPDHLLDRRDEIVKDLRDALIEYGDGGIYSSTTSHDTTLTI